MNIGMAGLNLALFRGAYSAFLRSDRVLLTGHSHQAWPDCARDAQLAYFDDTASLVDDKWGRAVFPKMNDVAQRVLGRLGFDAGDALAFGKSTHELVFRLLTCLRWSERPRIVTTTAEFHSLHRQLSRLEEEGVEVVWVDATERATLSDRLLAAINDRTAMVATSAVLFEDAFVLPRLGEIVSKAVHVGAIPLIDAYHAFNVVPLDLGPDAAQAFVTAGGYKYAQFGEGVCFLRFPKDTTLRPVYTGWFADFEALEQPRHAGRVGYGHGGERFSGATFDASGIYRASAVLDHFERYELDVVALRARSLEQTSALIAGLERRGLLGDKLSLASSRDPDRRAGFVALRSPQAGQLVEQLRVRGISVDARGELLRLGPAPYVTPEELDTGLDALTELVGLRPTTPQGPARRAEPCEAGSLTAPGSQAARSGSAACSAEPSG